MISAQKLLGGGTVLNRLDTENAPIKRIVILALSIVFVASFSTFAFGYSNINTNASSLDITKKSVMLSLLKDFPKDNSQDFFAFIGSKPGIYVPNPMRINDDFTKLPTPPNLDFKHLLNSVGNVGTSFPLPFELAWLPQERVGELINIDGSASCSTWLFFSSNGMHTFQIKTPNIFEPYVCSTYGHPYDQNEGFLVQDDDHVVAIVFERTEIKFPKLKYSLYWQSLTSSGWSPAQSVSIGAVSNH